MARAYFIGGAPRVGKTTLLREFLRTNPIFSLSTDPLRHALRQVISETDEPGLFNASKFLDEDAVSVQELSKNPSAVLDRQKQESAIVWRSVRDYVKNTLSGGRDVIVEGIAILPELFVSSGLQDYRCVFIGNTSKKHSQIIYHIARDNEFDWMHHLQDETIEAFGVFSQRFSEYLRAETEKYNLPYVEMSEGNFEDSIERATAVLLNGDKGQN